MAHAARAAVIQPPRAAAGALVAPGEHGPGTWAGNIGGPFRAPVRPPGRQTARLPRGALPLNAAPARRVRTWAAAGSEAEDVPLAEDSSEYIAANEGGGSEALESFIDTASNTLAAVRSLFEFPLEPFQEEAVRALLEGKSVVVSAPTGSGKTLVAEAAAAAALAKGERLIYTTPLKALSNQKLREFRERFGRDRVGLVTGDAVVNKDAPLVVMTTEILRNILYSSAGKDGDGTDVDPTDDRLSGVATVVLDEVHYLSDEERGTVWEESIIYCPREVQLCCLSATVSNPDDRKNRGGDSWGEVGSSFSSGGRRGGGNYNWEPPPTKRFYSPDVTETLDQLRGAEMLPAIWFVFSRKGCDMLVSQVAGGRGSLVTVEERRDIQEAVDELRRASPDAVRESAVEPLLRGVAAHHAGLLPAWKGLVERCFQGGLIKVVFATDTLAAGINMPARGVVLSALSRRTGKNTHSMISPNSLLQMAGRAGRRGYDTVGHCVIVNSRWEGPEEALGLLRAGPQPLSSHFSVGYGMVLNLLRGRSTPQVEALIARSFGNYLGGAGKQRQTRKMAQLTEQLEEARAEANGGVPVGIDPEVWLRYSKLQGVLREEKRALRFLREQAFAARTASMREALSAVRKAQGGAEPLAVVGLATGGAKEVVAAGTAGTAVSVLPALLVSVDVEAEAAAASVSPEDSPEDSSEDSSPESAGFDAALSPWIGIDPLETDDGVMDGADDDDDDDDDAGEAEGGGAYSSPTAAPEDPATYLCLGADNRLYRVGPQHIMSVAAVGEFRFAAAAAGGGGDEAAPSAQETEVWELDDALVGEARRAVSTAGNWAALSGGAFSASGTLKTARAAARLPPAMSLEASGWEEGWEEAVESQRTRVRDCKKELKSARKDADIKRAAKRSNRAMQEVRRLEIQVRRLQKRLRSDRGAGVEELRAVQEVLVRAGALERAGGGATGVEETLTLLPLGELASSVRSRNELWLATALVGIDDVKLTPPQLAGVLGGLITAETVDRGTMWSAYEPSPAVEQALLGLEPARENLQRLQGAVWPPVEVPLRVDTRLAGLVEAWVGGVAWEQIVRDSSIDEGDMARLLLRTADVLRQVASALPHIGALTQFSAKEALKSIDRAPISEMVQ